MIQLRGVTEYDHEFLYHLLAERPAEANISHREMPTYDDHVAFVRSHPYFVWYIIEVDGAKAGSIYLTKQGQPGFAGDEIGISVLAEHQRKGVASKAVRELMQLHPRKRYLANIAPKNRASKKMFESIGFDLLQHTYELRRR